MDLGKEELDRLKCAIEAIGAVDFWALLHDFHASLVSHEMGGAFAYIGKSPPVRLFDTEQTPERDRVHEILEKVGYLLSPYYNGLIRTGADDGFYHINDVAPDAFRKSEYFHVYWGEKSVSDEGMFLSCIDDATIVFMVERRKNRSGLKETELTCLRAAAGLVSSLIKRHIRLVGVGRIISPEERERQVGFQRIAECFGADFLSNREREVALLILRGHSSKSAARELGIAPETERVHRKRLYGRLHISSHSDLFSVFLEAADHFDPERNNDPLVEYLRIVKPHVLEGAAG